MQGKKCEERAMIGQSAALSFYLNVKSKSDSLIVLGRFWYYLVYVIIYLDWNFAKLNITSYLLVFHKWNLIAFFGDKRDGHKV